MALVIAVKSVQSQTACQQGQDCLHKTCMMMQQPLYLAVHHLESSYTASYRVEVIET